jgi:phenylacetic acid degradation operon negative regulatory protein
MRARSALFTLFGDVVRPAGGEAWLATLTGCMGALGFTPEATRTALHRMAAEGWVDPRRVGRYAVYRLTDRGVDRLEEAAARIFRLRRVDWDGRWRFLVGPSVNRRPDLARALRWMGFGRLSGDTWVSPHAHGERLTTVLAEHDASDGVLRFVTDPRDTDPARDRQVVATAWDLGGLRDAHAAFIARWSAEIAPDEAQAAFATRVTLVHDWRAFLHLDPGLPASLLPDDWLGDAAAGCFRRVYEAVERPAWRFYDGLATAAPGGLLAGSDAGEVASPFATGLHVLQTRTPA